MGAGETELVTGGWELGAELENHCEESWENRARPRMTRIMH